MKKLTWATNAFAKILISFLLVLACLHTQAQQKEFMKYYKNGKIYTTGKFINTACGKVLLVTTKDSAGNKIREEEWLNTMRCGYTRVFSKNIISKEIKFNQNLIVSYIAYVNGRVYTQISEDRNTIINKGILVNVRWKRYYEKIGNNRYLAVNKKELVDLLRYSMMPEDITQLMANISKLFDDGKVPGADAIVSCGGKTSDIPDIKGAASGSAPASGQPTAEDLAAQLANTCAANTGASLTAPINDKIGNAATKERIAKAQGAFDKMIANCESNPSNTSSGGMFSMEPPASNVASVAGINAIHEYTSQSTITDEERLAAGRKADAMGNKLATQIAGYVIGGPGGRTFAVFSILSPSVMEWLVKATLPKEEVVETPPATDATTSGTATGGAAGESENTGAGAGTVNSGSNTGANGGASATMPIPGGESGNTCDRMRSFKAYCDNNGWKDMRCQDAARFISGCSGDVREMLIADDGNVSSVGCPGGLSEEYIAAVKCKALGMFAMPAPGGTLCKTKGQVEGVLPNPALDPEYSDPIPHGDYIGAFSQTSVKVATSGAELSSMIGASKKPTMVVIMNPDCSSCQTFTGSLKSPEVNAAMANMNIVVVDGTLALDVMADNKVMAYPTFFVVKNGIKSTLNIGTLSAMQTASFMNSSK